ncbi:hypothetical protein A2584_05070 [Candidatus Beckwithbacteria bacterium RIFOXYD1_FULL_50_11]|nr:MAG: hypothetical protein A2584_05070 [Candidatus Beckwithbacteria bacterium RIFOXYD1_FULL_50_11]
MREKALWQNYQQLHQKNPAPDSEAKVDFYNQNSQNIKTVNHAPNPEAAIIIPAHNESILLPRALAAINQALTFSQTSLSVIVVDNASADATPEIAHAFGPKVVSQPKKGVAWARQAGLYAVEPSTRFILTTDADTVVSENWLSPHLKELADTANQTVFTHGPISYECDFKDDLVKWFLYEIYKRAAFQVQKTKPEELKIGIGGGNSGFIKSVALKENGYNTTLHTGEDIDLMKRILNNGQDKRVDASVITSNRRIIHQDGIVYHSLRKLYCNVVYFATGGHWPGKTTRKP